jgi:hypothetical protein
MMPNRFLHSTMSYQDESKVSPRSMNHHFKDDDYVRNMIPVTPQRKQLKQSFSSRLYHMFRLSPAKSTATPIDEEDDYHVCTVGTKDMKSIQKTHSFFNRITENIDLGLIGRGKRPSRNSYSFSQGHNSRIESHDQLNLMALTKPENISSYSPRFSRKSLRYVSESEEVENDAMYCTRDGSISPDTSNLTDNSSSASPGDSNMENPHHYGLSSPIVAAVQSTENVFLRELHSQDGVPCRLGDELDQIRTMIDREFADCGSRIQWMIASDERLTQGSQITYPAIMSYIMKKAIRLMTAAWEDIVIFICFKRQLNLLSRSEAKKSDREYGITGRLSVTFQYSKPKAVALTGEHWSLNIDDHHQQTDLDDLMTAELELCGSSDVSPLLDVIHGGGRVMEYEVSLPWNGATLYTTIEQLEMRASYHHQSISSNDSRYPGDLSSKPYALEYWLPCRCMLPD